MENQKRLCKFPSAFSLLINNGSVVMEFILRVFCPFWCNWNLREMKRRGLAIFAGDSPKDSGSVLVDPCLWELCFSLVFPLWELCYSLASC